MPEFTIMEYSDKQQQIMDAALALFAENGYLGTSVRDIAQAAEVNIAMVSYYFGSKEKLLEAVFHQHFSRIHQRLAGIIFQKGSTPAEKVTEVIDSLIEVFEHTQTFYQLMHREATLLKSGPIYDMISKMKAGNRILVEKAVRAGQRSGAFRQDVNVSLLAAILIGSVTQTLVNSRYEAERKGLPEREKDEFIQGNLGGLRAYLSTMFLGFLTTEKT